MENTSEKSGVATVLTVMLGTFMSGMDINVVNMALPVMQNSFHTAISAIEWVAIAYLLTLGATQLTFGRLSDLLGHKKIYVSGFMLFTLSSLACSLSGILGVLIAFRVLQALGAAMMQSSGAPLIIAAVKPQNRGKSLGMIAVAVAVATCVGPVLGGMLTSRFGWNSIFLINLPIGIIGSAIAIAVLQKDEKRSDNVRFDIAGSILIIFALFFILLPLNFLSRSAMQWSTVSISIVAGIAALVIFIVVELKNKQPLLNLSLFRDPVFAGSNFAALFYYMAEFIMIFLAPYFFQNLYGLSAMYAGMMMLPMSFSVMIGAPISGAIADRFDSRILGSAGLALMAAGIVLFSFYNETTPVPFIIISMFLIGLGSGIFQTPNTSAVMGSVPAFHRGIASSTLGTMRTAGMAIGEAVSAALISYNMKAAAPVLMSKGMRGNALWKSEFAPSSHITCLVAAACILVAIVLSMARGHIKPADEVESA
jgi:EmrB/QacA subfamily drug resistance transporter